MSKDNDFEIIDDFDDLMPESTSNPVVQNEIPSNDVENKINESIMPQHSYGKFDPSTIEIEDYGFVPSSMGQTANNVQVEKIEPSLETNSIDNKINEQPEIPSFSIDGAETTEMKKEETVSTLESSEPVTFEFDGFEGVLDNEHKETQVNPVEPLVAPSIEQEEEKEESSLVVQPVEPLAAPGTLNVMSSNPALNMDVNPNLTTSQSNIEEQPVKINPVLPNGEPVVAAVENKEVTEPKDNNSNNTGKIAFIVILFVIIALVIIFLPQISQMLG